MGQDFDGFRGRGRGRGRGDGGNSRGFRGGGRGGSPGGFRGGFRGGSDRGGGFRGGFRSERGGFGGDRGNFRGGFRGGDRGNFRGGDRGNFRGGDRGGFRGGDRGNSRGGFRGGRGSHGGKPMDKTVTTSHQYQEVRDGLQLFVIYKNAPTLEDTKQNLNGFHSRTSRPVGKDPGTLAHILLFTDVESLEAAKTKLEVDDNVESVDYMGMRSAKKQPDVKETRQLYLRFEEPLEEAEVKELDEKIVSVTVIKNNKKLYLAEYPSLAEAREAFKVLKEKVGQESKLEAVRESFGMNFQVEAQQGINRGMVVFRDVPKTTTLKDIAAVFPDAISFQLFRNTFHESKYCHAAIGFDHMNKVNDILDAGPREFLGKKIYPFPAHASLLQDVGKLGKQKSEEVVAAAKVLKEATSGPPNKKVKLEKEDEDDEGDDEEDDEDGDGEGEGEEDDDDDDEEEGGDDAEGGDDDEDDDESD